MARHDPALLVHRIFGQEERDALHSLLVNNYLHPIHHHASFEHIHNELGRGGPLVRYLAGADIWLASNQSKELSP